MNINSSILTGVNGAEVAGLRTHGIRYRKGTQFCVFARGPALGEVYVNGSFALMYRRTDSKGTPSDRMFQVTDSSFEILPMSHDELVEAVNRLADAAE